MIHTYTTRNAAMATTAVQGKVTTGTAVKTMLQLATPSTRKIEIVSWGFELDANPATLGVVELIQTDVAATVTAHVAAGVQPLDPDAPASLLTLGTAATGYTATAEGAITATRTFDIVPAPVAAGTTDLKYVYQFMPDERPIVDTSSFLRVRVHFGAAVDMRCWIRHAE